MNEPDDPTPPRLPAAARMKLHLYEVRAEGRLFRVVTPRPSCPTTFSTNFFHQTWHILTGGEGARLFARLLWGLSYQKLPDTVVALWGRQIRPTPFEAEKSDPILLVANELGRPSTSQLHALRRSLSRQRTNTRTVRWQTPGLDRVLAQHREERRNLGAPTAPLHPEHADWRIWRLREQESMERRGGFVVFSAPAVCLRMEAPYVHRIDDPITIGGERMEYGYMELPYPDGEIQVFPDYDAMVGAACKARAETLARDDAPADPEQIAEVVARQRRRLMAMRRRGKAARQARARTRRAEEGTGTSSSRADRRAVRCAIGSMRKPGS